MTIMKGIGRLTLIFLLSFFMSIYSSSVYAYDSESKDILERIRKLENEIADLKAKLSAVKEELAESTAASGGKPILSSDIPIEVYGFIKTDVVYSDSQVNDIVSFSAASGTESDNDEFLVSAKLTRLGLNLTGVEIGDNGILKGKIETDFKGGGDVLRLRQAYITLNYPKWSVLAGEAWDFFSPLNPSMLNFGILRKSGNLGTIRHGMVYLTNKLGKITTKVGVIDSGDSDQEDSGWPCLAGHIAYKSGRLYFGVGALYGQSDVSGSDVDTWAGTVALKYKLTDRIKFVSEGYYGSNISAFMGGSPTGILNNKGVRGIGGWAQLSITPIDKLVLSVGGGADDVKLAETSGDIWDINYSFFANMKLKLTKNIIWGLEFQRLTTKYTHKAGGDVDRYQSSLIYKF